MKRKSAWTPGDSDMVCSEHFVNGMPTDENPYPSLRLGYEPPPKRARRVVLRPETFPANQVNDLPSLVQTDDAETSTAVNTDIEGDPVQLHGEPNHAKGECADCTAKSSLIGALVNGIKSLSLERDQLKEKVGQLSHKIVRDVSKAREEAKVFSWKRIKSDAKMKFYTGIQTVALFSVLFSLIQPCLPNLVYWRGKKNILSTKYKRTATKRSPKLDEKNQFLLVLMRLRLGLLNEDLADRFNISQATCSSIFTTWIRLLSSLLGDALVRWLPRETVYSNLPSMFRGKYRKTRCIIDCSEVYIERPKSVDEQAATWSDYKKHNTFKFLIAISPNGFIMFLSDCYGGRTTDQFICKDSNFYNLLEAGDEIMADRGFQIKEDLLLYYCSLSVPPGARIKAQFCMSECEKTKEVANLRIHVERAINRLKEFKILKSVVPINMLTHADSIVKTCAALCNLQSHLINEFSY